MNNLDAIGHVRGKSVYVDDLPTLQGTCYAAVFDSPVAHGRLRGLDASQALAMPGVLAVLTCAHIPGENQIGGILPDEPLLAEGAVHFCGQPIALVLAEDEHTALAARRLIAADIEPLPVVTDPREAQRMGELILPPRTFQLGQVDEAWAKCAHIFEGRADVNGQEHLYIETQGAYAVPGERGQLKIFSSTQGPTAVQRMAARVLGMGMHQIEVDVNRLGGGFGGKEDQATPWAVLAALGAQHLQRPVKLILHRMDDMRMTGKRHPYSADYKIGLSVEGKILAYEATFYQNAGAAADLSPAVLERTLFHCTNAYFVPNVRATAYSCRTHLPPNTAFRGFGGPQGMFVMEAALAHAAEGMGLPAAVLQRRNLLREGDSFPYGQRAEGVEAEPCWKAWEDAFGSLQQVQQEAVAFNQRNEVLKRGVAAMPICFGISFTKTPMNQARALVHIYSDGTVGVSTGAVEMGQGVNTKMVQVAASVLSLPPARVKLETTNTTRVSNTSPSAASATADLNGKALQQACEALRGRLLACAAQHLGIPAERLALGNGQVLADGKPSGASWEQLVEWAFLDRVALTENGHYATPIIHFDKQTEKGHPFAYHVYGLAVLEATVDCLRGTYSFDRVRVLHDYGQSMNMDVDLGQIEGGLVQGLGWMTMEEIVYDEQGRLRSQALSTYKVPDLYSVPAVLDVRPLEAEGAPLAIFKSKAVGEPPLMYGIGGYFAIREAVRAFRPKAQLPFDAPFTPEKVLLALHGPR